MYFGLFVALNVLCMKMEINVNENCAGVESEYNLNGNIGMLREKNPRIDKKRTSDLHKLVPATLCMW